MPEQQHQEFVVQAQAVQAYEVASQIRARVQVDIHGIAGEGAQEEPSGPNGQGFTSPLQRQPSGQGCGQQHRNVGIDITPSDRFPHTPNHRGFILTTLLACDPCE
jgi:hypothetical protein